MNARTWRKPRPDVLATAAGPQLAAWRSAVRVAAIALIVPAAAGRVRAESALLPGSDGRAMIRISPVSDAFSREAEAAAQSIPWEIWSAVADAGWRIYLAEQVVDAVPALRGAAPRGWPAGAQWDNTDAVHLPASRQLVVAEKRRNRKGQVVRCTRVGGVLRHELGHAFDMAGDDGAGFRSASPEFRKAYHADIAAMDAGQRQELAYYLQESEAGRQETFAEAFGIAFGGGSDAAHRDAFVAGFPQSLAAVQEEIAASRSPTSHVTADTATHVPEPTGSLSGERRGPLRRWR